MSWVLKWNFDKPNYSPGETAIVYFRAENLGQTPIYIADVSLEFDFGTYLLRDVVSGFIMPRQVSRLC